MTRPRLTLHWLRAAALFASGGLWHAKRVLRARGSIVVLAFHRVLDDADLARTNSLAGMIIRRRTFERLTEYVSRRYTPVAIEGGTTAWDSGQLQFAFTFDDGWLDTCTVALPIAAAHGVPFTVFVCPGLVGMKAPFWPERAAAAMKNLLPAVCAEEIEVAVENLKRSGSSRQKQLLAHCDTTRRGGADGDEVDSTMSWDQLSMLAAAGVCIGSHGQTHQILTTLSESEARPEIRTSREAIERELKQSCPLFSYPNGNASAQMRGIVAEAGYELAFTMARGAWSAASEKLAIPRINICEDGVIGPRGRFSRLRFEYTVFWQAWRARPAKRGPA